MIWLLLVLPMAAGGAAFLIRPNGPRRALLLAVAAAHLAVTVTLLLASREPGQGIQVAAAGWVELDAAGRVFLGIASVLFAVVSIYAVGYLAREERAAGRASAAQLSAAIAAARANDAVGSGGWLRRMGVSAELLPDKPEASFTGWLLVFMGTMTLVTVSRHLGLLWVGVEATTLASAPLIYYHRHARSLEATWKYLLVCSVGIALALMGNFFVAAWAGAGQSNMSLSGLLALGESGKGQNLLWLKAGLVFLLVGYGTKMALAPLHTWLPDAHSESPSVVSALMSGVLVNCAFLAVFRGHQLCVSAGIGDFSRELLVVMGLVSMVAAAAFVVIQTDFKRLLAYSTVEHMGILALGLGVGAGGAFGSMLHAVNHALTKGMLFLVAGNIVAAYRTRATDGVRGMLSSMPIAAVLWLGGLLAITGSPPFGTFLSEFTILRAALSGGHAVAACVFLGALVIVFVGMIGGFLRMAQGVSPLKMPAAPEPRLAVWPPAALGLAVLVLGVYVPEPIRQGLEAAASLVTGGRP